MALRIGLFERVQKCARASIPTVGGRRNQWMRCFSVMGWRWRSTDKRGPEGSSCSITAIKCTAS